MICFGARWDLQMWCGNCHFQTETWTLKENTVAKKKKKKVSFVPLQKHIFWEKSASDSLKYWSFLYCCVLGLAALLAQRGGMLFHDDCIWLGGIVLFKANWNECMRAWNYQQHWCTFTLLLHTLLNDHTTEQVLHFHCVDFSWQNMAVYPKEGV